MAQFTGGIPLEFEASVNTAEFEKGLKKIAIEASKSAEDLNKRFLDLKSFSFFEKDITKVKAYNKEMQLLDLEMKRLQNIGKAGFDEMGNAIEKTTGKTNLLSKGFGFLRNIANILPGIGIAGLLSFAIDPLLKYIKTLQIFGTAADSLKQSVKDQNAAIEKSADEYGKATQTVSTLTEHVDLAKKGFLDKDKVLKEYNDTMGKTTGHLKNFDLLEKKLIDDGPDYIKLLFLKAQATASYALAGEAAKKSLTAQIDAQKEFGTQEFVSSNVGNALKRFFGFGDLADVGTNTAKQINKNGVKIKEEAEKAFKSFTKQGDTLTEQAAALANSRKFDLFGGDLDPKKVKEKAKASTDAIIAEGKRLAERVAQLQGEAEGSGLPKTNNELRKIAEKYDTATKALIAYNEKVAAFNKKNKTNVASLGQDEFDKLAVAKTIELANTKSKQEAAIYIQSLSKQKDIFTKYENAKKEIGLENANKLFAGQTKGFETNIQYLSSEFLRFFIKVQSGMAKVGDVDIFRALGKQLEEAKAKEDEDRIKRYAALLNDTMTFEDKKKEIIKKYAQKEIDLELLNKDKLVTNYEERKAVIAQQKNEELTGLENNIVRQGDLYKRLNLDLIKYSAETIRTEEKALNHILKTDTTLTPEQQGDVKARIKELRTLLESTDKAADKFEVVGNGLNKLSNALRGVNSELANTIAVFADISLNVASGLKSLQDFKDADSKTEKITAGIGIASAAINIVSGVLSFFKAAKESRIQAQKEIDAFNEHQRFGQIDYNIELRKTELAHIVINKLRLQGIQDQKEMLAQQKQSNKLAYDLLLQQIQAQQFITGEHTEKFGGVLGVGRKTRVVQDLGSLAGTSFEDLERLFNSGQLTEKASALFQELQKLKQEGIDIESQLADAKKQADELFTGTTAESITDSIADGFAQGFKSVQDFAGKTEDIIRGAMLSALKTQALEGPIKKLYEQFAADAASGGGLDLAEVASFQANTNKIVQDAAQFAEAIAKATGVSLTSAANSQNSLAGSIKAQLTEQTGTVIAGAFNGLRLTAIQQLNIATRSLDVHNKIEANTAASAQNIADTNRLLRSVINGDKIRV